MGRVGSVLLSVLSSFVCFSIIRTASIALQLMPAELPCAGQVLKRQACCPTLFASEPFLPVGRREKPGHFRCGKNRQTVWILAQIVRNRLFIPGDKVRRLLGGGERDDHYWTGCVLQNLARLTAQKEA